MKMIWTCWSPKRRRPTTGMRVRRESRSAVDTDRSTDGALPGIELPGGLKPAYPRGQDPWDVWSS